jgi:hypothetical protein
VTGTYDVLGGDGELLAEDVDGPTANQVAIERDGAIVPHPDVLPDPPPRQEGPDLLKTSELAARWRTTEKSVRRWAAADLLAHCRTPGGQYRFFWSAELAVGLATPLMTPGEAMSALGLSSAGLIDRAKRGKVACIRLPGGGHRRYVASSVLAQPVGRLA